MSELASRTSQPSPQTRVRARGPVTRTLVVLGLLGAATGLVVGLRWGEPDPRFATAAHENPAGGYAFRYPPAWAVETEGTTSRLRSRNRSVAISFGLGAARGLPAASGALVKEIRRGYEDVRILGTEEQLIGGRPAIQVFGTGTNERGIQVRFVAISIEGHPGRPAFAITAFTAEGADPHKVLPTLNEIVGSFSVT